MYDFLRENIFPMTIGLLKGRNALHIYSVKEGLFEQECLAYLKQRNIYATDEDIEAFYEYLCQQATIEDDEQLTNFNIISLLEQSYQL